jgi:hypothetical protein
VPVIHAPGADPVQHLDPDLRAGAQAAAPQLDLLRPQHLGRRSLVEQGEARDDAAMIDHVLQPAAQLAGPAGIGAGDGARGGEARRQRRLGDEGRGRQVGRAA